MSSELKVILVENADQLAEAHRVRIQVFVKEQKFEISTEIDEVDSKCIHWLLLPSDASKTDSVKNLGVGAIRLVPCDDPTNGYLGRLCLLKESRGKGLAKPLVYALHSYAKEHGIKKVDLTAQMDKVEFYKKFGYTVDDETPVDVDGAPHIHMSLKF